MVLLCNIKIPLKKSLKFSLLYIFGIGFYNASFLYQHLGLSQRKAQNFLDLDDSSLAYLERFILSKYLIELDLKRSVSNNIFLLKNIKSYRGLRHVKGLPCRGQRTRSNCNNCKKITKKLSIY